MCDVIHVDDGEKIIPSGEQCAEHNILINQNIIEDESIKSSSSEAGKLEATLKIPYEKLSSGLLSLYIDDFMKTSSSLCELTQNQSIVIDILQQENTKFSAVLNMKEISDMFSRLKLYNARVQSLKKEMLFLVERTNKLKKRALKLQQQKQKEALQKELQRDREIERDKQLAPKIVTKSPPTK